jgi:hypothetical protein
MANLTHKLDPVIMNAKSTENMFMRLELWVDDSLKIMQVFFFFPMLKNVVAIATNRLRIWQI